MGEVEDLQGAPQVSCDGAHSCQLLFESGTEDPIFGASSPLRRDEAKWLHKLLTERMVANSKDAGLDARRFKVPVTQRRPRRQEDDYHHRRSSGFYGGGF